MSDARTPRKGGGEVDEVFAMLEGVAGDPVASESAMRAIRALPCWTADVAIEPLPGGISNLNFVAHHQGCRYVVRYGADMPDLGIRRANEAAALKAASAAGVAPKVIFAEREMIVMEALDGTVLTPADLSDHGLLRTVGHHLAIFHRQSARFLDGPDFIFWPYHHGRWYARQIAERAARIAPSYAARAAVIGAQVDPLERAVGTCTMVFGHGDLVPQNIMRCADGIRFIDLEYAGFAPDLFDLGALGMNAELDPAAIAVLLEAYYGAAPTAELMHRYGAMVLIASIRETLWCIKKMLDQEGIAFDYSIYADMCLNRHERLLAVYGDAVIGKD